jgi:hypothetical protein
METIFAILLIIIFLFNINNNSKYFILSVFYFLRIDIFCIVLGCVALLFLFESLSKHKFMAFQFTLLFLAVFLPILLSAFMFDSIIPNTIIAKNVIYKNSFFEDKLFDRLRQLLTFGYSSFVSFALFCLIVYYNVRKFKMNLLFQDLRYIYFYFLISYFLFELIFVTHLNIWYIPIITFLVIIILFSFKDTMYQKYFYMIISICLLYSVYGNKAIFENRKDNLFSTDLYQVSQIVGKESTVFCGDIGVIGYYSKAYIYDWAGLITPEAICYNKRKYKYKDGNVTTHYEAILEQIENVKPDFVNFRQYPFYELVISDFGFSKNYNSLFNGKQENLFKRITSKNN